MSAGSAAPGAPVLGRDAVVLAATAPLAPALAAVLGNGWPGIVLAGSLAFAFLVRHRNAARGPLIVALLAWAAALSACYIVLTVVAEARAAVVIPSGAAYWEEMRVWLWTGEGREATPAEFVPQHVVHLAAFVVLAAATGGWAGLLLGTWLLAYMSFYVGKVAAQASAPLLAGLLAWHPWSVVRVVAYIVIGVALSRLVLDRLPPRRFWAEERRALGLGLGLWVLDLVMKAFLAPRWPALLRSLF